MIQLGIVGNGFQQCMVAGMVLKLSIFLLMVDIQAEERRFPRKEKVLRTYNLLISSLISYL